jgi:excinuclease UvrABC ATPase subunit
MEIDSADDVSTSDSILISGARHNNLKGVSLRIPKGLITVFTGVSGSGKSSVVFDTIAVESQRQLNETFSWFIRNRLPRYERPKAEAIENLSAAIVVDQRPVGGNARSTVGTMTEINPFLRVLFSRHGQPSAGESSAYSFNDPAGMCPECEGLGRAVRLDLDRLLDESQSLNEGAIRFPAARVGTWWWSLYARSGLFDPDKPLRDYSDEERELLLRGEGLKVDPRRGGGRRAKRQLEQGNTYEGLASRFERLYLKRDLTSASEDEQEAIRRVVRAGACPMCHGARLNEAALRSRIAGRNLADYCALEVTELIEELASIEDPVAAPVAEGALARLRRIDAIGLGYLRLDRETSTLSGGEAQRLKTVRHLGSSLTGLTYIFDEPSVGLHPRDVHRLTRLLRALRDKGNTVLVVEHDRDVIAIADHVVDMGPGAGTDGGEVVFEGPVAALRESDTPTGRCLRRTPGLKERGRAPTGSLTIAGASLHNLHDVTVDIPTGVLTAVTGVAGSGKSTLISGVFTERHPDAVVVDQSAIGISPRSTPATYVGAMDAIRRLFAAADGLDAGHFSFNSAGACPTCRGRGVIQTDLAFMDPVTTTCERCGGRRFREEVLAVTLDGASIADVLEMTAEQARGFFGDATVVRRLAALAEVGLGYLTLGQPLSTLSGGERQRLKLAKRLRDTGHVYVFDEPTTGLHMADVDGLLALLDRLVDAGNTVIVVEHDRDVIKHADWVIDLGPEAGQHGGRVVFEGTPAELLAAEGSHTAEHLRRELAAG